MAFFVASISIFTYFSMWTEKGILRVAQEDEDRILFPAWYLDWAITLPTLVGAIGLVGNWAGSSIVASIGSAVMMLGLLWFGAVSIKPPIPFRVCSCTG